MRAGRVIRRSIWSVGSTLVLLGACSNATKHPPPTSDIGGMGGVGGKGGGTPDAASDAPISSGGDANAWDVALLDAQNSGSPCPANVVGTKATFDVDVSALSAYAGPFELRGEVSFPDTVPAATTVYFGISPTPVRTLTEVTQLFRMTLPQASGSITYALHSLTTGVYYVMFSVDINADGKIDTGDLAGFYAGSVGAAITDGTLATQVVVASAPVCGIDWGLGQL